MTIVDDNWIYKQTTTGTNRDVETIITGDTDSDFVKVGSCKDCIWHEGWGEICYKYGYEARDKEIVRCKDCKHSIINHGRYCTFGDCLGCLVSGDFYCKNVENKNDSE